jgi:hypothetical protein
MHMVDWQCLSVCLSVRGSFSSWPPGRRPSVGVMLQWTNERTNQSCSCSACSSSRPSGVEKRGWAPRIFPAPLFLRGQQQIVHCKKKEVLFGPGNKPLSVITSVTLAAESNFFYCAHIYTSYLFSCTPSVSFYLSLDSSILYYSATNKTKQREYIFSSY